MGLDSYSGRKLDQVKNDSKVVDEIEQLNLDPDLKAELRKAKKKLEMERFMSKGQNEYDKGFNEVDSALIKMKSMDSMSLFDRSLNGLSSKKSTQQEETMTNFWQKYSNEEEQEESITNYGLRYNEKNVQEAKESIERNIKAGEELLVMLEEFINKHNDSDSMDEEYTPKHK